MDTSQFPNQTLRNEQLLRLLKQFELEAHNSLRGPAAIGAMPCPVSSSSSGGVNGAVPYQPQFHSLANAAPFTAPDLSKLALPKLLDGSLVSSMQRVGRKEQPGGSIGPESFLAVDRSVLLQRDALVKELLALKGVIPIQPSPALTIRERTPCASERKETQLEGGTVTCFMVGGEKRLCFPQVLNTVLKNVPMVDVNRACSELNIHCGQCTPEQLHSLKIAGVVSATAASCALITKTDAERLCDYTLRQSSTSKSSDGVSSASPQDTQNRTASRLRITGGKEERGVGPVGSSSSRQKICAPGERINRKSDAGLSIRHFCFGGCSGQYFPSLYASPSAECIQCDECSQWFTPDRFVVHSHGNQERHTCHWGFDSANWRAYLHTNDEEECKENVKSLEDMKLRFNVTGLTKRRLNEDGETSENCKKETAATQSCGKRIRMDQSQNSPTAAIPKENVKMGGPSFPVLTQPTLPYFLCDPVLMANCCHPTMQNILSNCFATAFRTATQHQPGQASVANATFPTLPSLPTSTTGPAHQVQHSNHQASVNCGVRPPAELELRPMGRSDAAEWQRLAWEGRLDEKTAMAALKLLQLHGDGDQDHASSKVFDQKRRASEVSIPFPKPSNDTFRPSSLSFSSASKEPFKKQLLHLFTAELQQKREQQKSSDPQEDEPVNVVDDDPPVCQDGAATLQQDTSRSESEKMNDNESTPDTQMTDDSSTASSDNEGAAAEVSLDDLLQQYIKDSSGLKLVRSKIAENQRYLEQKLDAVSSENRVLLAECQQLRTAIIEPSKKQELTDNSFVKNVAGFVSKQCAL